MVENSCSCCKRLLAGRCLCPGLSRWKVRCEISFEQLWHDAWNGHTWLEVGLEGWHDAVGIGRDTLRKSRQHMSTTYVLSSNFVGGNR